MTEKQFSESLDHSEWDQFVEGHPLGQIYHTSAWKEVLEESFKQIKGRNLILRDERSGAITAGLPLFEIKSWLTGNRLVCVPFGTLCDPLISSKEEFTALLNQAQVLKKELNSNYIEIKTFQGSDFIDNGTMIFHAAHKHHYLHLDKDFEQLKKTFKRTVRQAVKKAVSSGLELSYGKSEEDLKDFYRLYIQTRKRNFVPVQPFRFFQNLLAKFSPAGSFSLMIVKKNRRSIGAGILLKFKKRVTLEFLASDNQFLSLRPNHLLAWNAIEKAQKDGYGIFDFGRTAPEDEGLMRFKKYWGTTIVDLMQAFERGNQAENLYNRESRGWKTASYLCGKLPVPLYCIFSNYCYRHLG